MSISARAAAREVPDAIAVVADGRSWSFAELAPRVDAEVVAISRAFGATPWPRTGPRLALVTARPTLDFILRLYALAELGVAPLLLHPRWSAEERAAAARVAEGAIDLDELPRAATGRSAEIVPATLPGDRQPLAVVFTSGSAGAPRGVVLSRAAFVASAHASAARLGWHADDRWLLSLSPAHIGGLSIITRCLLARKPVVLGAGGDPVDLLDVIIRGRVTLASLVAAQLRRLLDVAPGPPPPALRGILLGGGPCPASLLDKAARRGWPVLTTYGLSQTCSQIATQAPGWRPCAQDGAGAPLPGIEVRIVDGEILVRGPVLMDRTLPAGAGSSGFTSDGWLATGDLGHLDARGNLHVLGRRDDVIVTGGEKVSPQEIEGVLASHPGVREALVFGVPDQTWGAIVAAALVLDPAEPPTDEGLRSHLAARLTGFKHPRLVARVSTLPMLPNGKPDRRGATTALAPVLRRLE